MHEPAGKIKPLTKMKTAESRISFSHRPKGKLLLRFQDQEFG